MITKRNPEVPMTSVKELRSSCCACCGMVAFACPKCNSRKINVEFERPNRLAVFCVTCNMLIVKVVLAESPEDLPEIEGK